VRYSGQLVWPLAGLALVAVLLLAVLARRQGRLSWPRLLAGMVLALMPIALAAAAAQALWLLLTTLRPGYADLLDPWRPAPFRLAVVALTAAVVLGWYALLRRVGQAALIVGALGLLAVLGLVLAAVVPGASYTLALPALAGGVFGLGALAFRGPSAALLPRLLGAGLAVVVLAPVVLLFFPALGLASAAVPAAVAALLGLALLPVLADLAPGRSAVVCLLLAATLVGSGLALDRFDADHPAPAQMMYALDADTGQARWVSTDTSPGDWARGLVDGTDDVADVFPAFELDEGQTVVTGPAAVADLPPPVLRTLSDTTEGGERTLELRLEPQRAVRLAYLGVTGHVLAATVAGRATPVRDGRFEVLFDAPPEDGLDVTLVLEPGPAAVRVMDGSDGLDGLPGFVPRPSGLGSGGGHRSDLVLVARTFRL
jgi:hypothetical protein